MSRGVAVLDEDAVARIADRAASLAVIATLKAVASRQREADASDPEREVAVRDGAKLARASTSAYLAALTDGTIPSRFEPGGRGGKGRRLAKVRDVLAWAEKRRASH